MDAVLVCYSLNAINQDPLCLNAVIIATARFAPRLSGAMTLIA